MLRRKQVEKITGIPARRIQFYTDSGLLKLAEQTPGKGNERKYRREDILTLLVISELSKYGMSLAKIREILDDRNVRSMILSTSEPGVLWLIDGEVFLGTSKNTPDSGFEVPAPWKVNTSVFYINISKLAGRIPKG